MKTPGIIGGIGPESTIDYYRSIIALWKEKTGDVSLPSILIQSIDLKQMQRWFAEETSVTYLDTTPTHVEAIVDEMLK